MIFGIDEETDEVEVDAITYILVKEVTNIPNKFKVEEGMARTS